ncbi:hypothetical protein NHX12_005811 [Muraenolepis orangiensis]|uniref:Uncharacterized protein n=1 Tax=Muraenolepis orangiensis TaxID=630683 RepID=A0A9Q0DVR0_9TELE|nr:hypothetical protein NHX12_005811 [Muraenolepis orangiensis]
MLFLSAVEDEGQAGESRREMADTLLAALTDRQQHRQTWRDRPTEVFIPTQRVTSADMAAGAEEVQGSTAALITQLSSLTFDPPWPSLSLHLPFVSCLCPTPRILLCSHLGTQPGPQGLSSHPGVITVRALACWGHHRQSPGLLGSSPLEPWPAGVITVRALACWGHHRESPGLLGQSPLLLSTSAGIPAERQKHTKQRERERKRDPPWLSIIPTPS